MIKANAILGTWYWLLVLHKVNVIKGCLVRVIMYNLHTSWRETRALESDSRKLRLLV